MFWVLEVCITLLFETESHLRMGTKHQFQEEIPGGHKTLQILMHLLMPFKNMDFSKSLKSSSDKITPGF